MQPIEYYKDSDKHGSYQYVPLKKIIDDFLFETTDDDSILKNVTRTKIIKQAKASLRDLNKEVPETPKAIEITVPENLSITLPHDYVSFHKLYLVVLDKTTNSYRLQDLNKNHKINIGVSQLQDNEYNLLFDNEGNVLTSNGSNTYNKPYKRYEFVKGGDNTQASRFGEYTIDNRKGKVAFSSDLYDKDIVLLYRTDGLQFDTYKEDVIKVHKDMITVLSDSIFYHLIRYKQHVSQRRIQAALLRYKTTRHEAKLEKLDFSLVEIEKAGRTAKF
jgi:hypothetical protein